MVLHRGILQTWFSIKKHENQIKNLKHIQEIENKIESQHIENNLNLQQQIDQEIEQTKQMHLIKRILDNSQTRGEIGEVLMQNIVQNELATGVGGLTYLQNLRSLSAPYAANWYYQPGMGWLWTNQDVYPLVYFADSNETGGHRWLYSIRLEDAPNGSYYDYLQEKIIEPVGE